MPFGGCSPFPSPYGGGEPVASALVRSLNQGMGNAYDTTPGTMVYAINLNVAREIAAAWATNQRLSNQGNPRKLTSCLARWERLIAAQVPYGDSDVARRERVAEHLARFGVATTHQVVVGLLSAKLGDVFVGVKYVSFDDAVITVPGFSYPWGTQSDTAPWSSTVARILVKTQKPSGYTEGQFYDAVGEVFRLLDPRAPAWCTFDWYRNGPGHSGLWIEDSEAGFFLDDDANLDNQVFDA